MWALRGPRSGAWGVPPPGPHPPLPPPPGGSRTYPCRPTSSVVASPPRRGRQRCPTRAVECACARRRRAGCAAELRGVAGAPQLVLSPRAHWRFPPLQWSVAAPSMRQRRHVGPTWRPHAGPAAAPPSSRVSAARPQHRGAATRCPRSPSIAAAIGRRRAAACRGTRDARPFAPAALPSTCERRQWQRRHDDSGPTRARRAFQPLPTQAQAPADAGPVRFCFSPSRPPAAGQRGRSCWRHPCTAVSRRHSSPGAAARPHARVHRDGVPRPPASLLTPLAMLRLPHPKRQRRCRRPTPDRWRNVAPYPAAPPQLPGRPNGGGGSAAASARRERRQETRRSRPERLPAPPPSRHVRAQWRVPPLRCHNARRAAAARRRDSSGRPPWASASLRAPSCVIVFVRAPHRSAVPDDGVSFERGTAGFCGGAAGGALRFLVRGVDFRGAPSANRGGSVLGGGILLRTRGSGGGVYCMPLGSADGDWLTERGAGRRATPLKDATTPPGGAAAAMVRVGSRYGTPTRARCGLLVGATASDGCRRMTSGVSDHSGAGGLPALCPHLQKLPVVSNSRAARAPPAVGVDPSVDPWWLRFGMSAETLGGGALGGGQLSLARRASPPTVASASETSLTRIGQ